MSCTVYKYMMSYQLLLTLILLKHIGTISLHYPPYSNFIISTVNALAHSSLKSFILLQQILLNTLKHLLCCILGSCCLQYWAVLCQFETSYLLYLLEHYVRGPKLTIGQLLRATLIYLLKCTFLMQSSTIYSTQLLYYISNS